MIAVSVWMALVVYIFKVRISTKVNSPGPVNSRMLEEASLRLVIPATR